MGGRLAGGLLRGERTISWAIRWAILGLGLAAGALPGPGLAQVWRADTGDNGAWFEAWVTAGEGLPSFHCGGVSPTGLPLPQSDEPALTKVGAVDLWMPDNGPMQQRLDPPPRSDLRLVTESQAFGLPDAYYDLLNFNGWVQTIGARDAALAALAGAQVWAIDGAHGRWGPFGTEGLGQALRTIISYCEARWNGVPAAPVAPAARPEDVSALLEDAFRREVSETCPAGATLDPGSPLRIDLDEDGINDIILDGRSILCITKPNQDHCGAALCGISVYLSSVYPRKGKPEIFLGIGATLVRGTDGKVWIGTGNRAAECPWLYDPITCTSYWRFDGQGVSAVPRP